MIPSAPIIPSIGRSINPDFRAHLGMAAGIVIYDSGRGNLYQKVMRFTLIDEEARTFKVQRWCFKGSIDDSIDLWMADGVGTLPDLVNRFCRHIGQESFYELM